MGDAEGATRLTWIAAARDKDSPIHGQALTRVENQRFFWGQLALIFSILSQAKKEDRPPLIRLCQDWRVQPAFQQWY